MAMIQPMKNVKEVSPIKSNRDPSVEALLASLLLVVVGLGAGVVPLDGGVVDDGLTLELLTSPPTVLNGVHDEVGGAGCAGGVTGSPWWKVEPP